MNAIYTLAEIGKWSIRNSCDSHDTKLNATSHECTPMKCIKRVENTDGRAKKNEGWVRPAKHDPTTCFHKRNNKSRKNNNVNTNRHNVFTDNA